MPPALTSEVRLCDPLSDPAWARLVERREGDVFHGAAWLRVLRRGYGFEPRARIVVDAQGRPRSGLVTCVVDDLLGRREIALPFSDFCDPLLGREEDWELLAGDWLSTAPAARLRVLRARAPLSDRRFTTSGWAWWHGVDLERGEAQLWNALDASARRNIARARSSGVSVSPARDRADLRAFFELHLALRKNKYRLLAQPYGFFEAIAEEFLEPGNGRLLLARKSGRVIAGVLLLEAGRRVYYKLNASDPESLELRPNDLLVWHALLHGLERGARLFDFGVSDHDQPGLVRYKRKYADLEGRVTTLQSCSTPAPGPAQADARRLLGELTELFTAPDVPDALTERAGDRLYRHFA